VYIDGATVGTQLSGDDNADPHIDVFTYRLTRIGSYRFEAVDVQSTVGDPIIAEALHDVSFLETAKPEFTVSSVGYNAAGWTSQSVIFTLAPASVPISGVEYYYNIDGGAWIKIAEFAAGVNPGNVNFYVDGILDGIYNSFSGSIAFRAVGKSHNAANGAVVSTSRLVRVDKYMPTLAVGNRHLDDTAPDYWVTTATHTLTLNMGFGASRDATGSTVTVTLNGTLLTTPVNPSSTSYIITENGFYRFTLHSAAGNTAYYEFDILFIDNVLPDYTVNVENRPIAANNYWTADNVEFSTTTTLSAASGVVYKIKLGDGAWTVMATVFDPIDTTLALGALRELTANFKGTVWIAAVRASEADRAILADSAFAVIREFTNINIDKQAPTLTIADAVQNAADPVKAWTEGNVVITLTTASTFADASLAVYVSTDPTFATKTLTTSMTQHIVTANGTYYFRTENGAGVTSPVRDITVSRIDRFDPNITVAVATGTSGNWSNAPTLTGWRSSDVRFTLSSTATPAPVSGVVFEYSIDGGTTWAKLEVKNTTWGTLTATTMTITADFKQNVRFRAIAGRFGYLTPTAGDYATYATTYSVWVDKITPTLTAKDQAQLDYGADKLWTTTNSVTITLAATFGTISAGDANNRIYVSIDGGVNYTYASLPGTQTTYTVSANYTYYFVARGANGEQSQPQIVTVDRIDTTAVPQLTVTPSTGYVNGAWTRDPVTFTLGIGAGTKPYSGITFMYRESANGADWGAWTAVGTPGSDTAQYGYSSNVVKYVEFKVVAGRSTVATPVEDVSITYIVKIDTVQPTLTAKDLEQDAYDITNTDLKWTTGGVTITFVSGFSQVGTAEGVLQHSTDNSTWTTIGNAATTTYVVTTKGMHYFRTLSPSQYPSEVASVNVKRIHTAVLPAISVAAPIANGSAYTLGAWTQYSVVFNLSSSPAQDSGVTYWYAVSPTNNFTSPVWQKDLTGSVFTFSSSVDTYIRFRVITNRDDTAQDAGSVSASYRVRIDKTPVTLTATTDNTVWHYPSQPVTFSDITFGASGTTAEGGVIQYRKTTGGAWITIPGGTTITTFAADTYGSAYFFQLLNGAGVASAEQTVYITHLDTNTTPTITVTNPTANANAWTAVSVTFDLASTLAPRSGVTYQFRQSADNGATWAIGWTNMDTSSKTYPAAAINVLVQFRVITGRNVIVPDGTNTYAVKIDPTRPVITAVADNTQYINGDRPVTVTVVTFGESRSEATSILEVSLTGTGGWVEISKASVSSFIFSAPNNVTYYFRATNAADVHSEMITVPVSKIDRIMPVLNVVTDGVTGSWTGGNVVFTLSVPAINTPASGVVYQYSSNGTTWTDFADDAWDGTAWVTSTDVSYAFTANLVKDTTVYFRVYAGRDSGVSNPPSATAAQDFVIMIDKTVPTLALDPTTVTAWQVSTALVKFLAVFNDNGTGSVGARLWRSFDGTSFEDRGTGFAQDTVTTNVMHYYYVVAANGLKSNTVSVDVGWIDNTLTPAINVEVSGDVANWTSGTVSFTLSATSVPTSGVLYQYTEDNGTSWHTMASTVRSYTTDTNLTVRFRAYAGSYLDTGKAASVSTNYTVRVDRTTPTVKASGFPTVYVNENDAPVPLTITVQFGISATDSASVIMLEKVIGAATSVIALKPTAGTPVAGKFTFTYNLIENGSYRFYATSASALSSVTTEYRFDEAADSANNLIANTASVLLIDRNPVYTVSHPGYTLNTWTSGNVRFVLTPSVVPASGATYWFSNDNGTSWTEIIYDDGYFVTVSTSFDGNLRFKAVAASDLTENGVAAGPYRVRVDKLAPVVTVTGIPAGYVNVTALSPVELQVTVQFGISGAESGYFIDTSIEGVPATAELTNVTHYVADNRYVFTYNINQNGSYEFYALAASGERSLTTWYNFEEAASSANNVKANAAEITEIEHLENLSITVTPPVNAATIVNGSRQYGWTSTGATPASGINYMYALIAQSSDVPAKDSSAWIALGTTNTVTIGGADNYAFDGYIVVMAYAGSDAASKDKAFISPAYQVRIDKKTPTLSVTGIPTSYQNITGYSVTLASVFGPAGGKFVVNGVVISTVNVAGSATANYLITENGEYSFGAVSAIDSGKTAVLVYDLQWLDNQAPRFAVTPRDGSVVTGWTQNPVAFDIVPQYESPSGVKYYYRLDEGAWIEITSAVTSLQADDVVITAADFAGGFGGAARISFKAESTVGLSYASTTVFDVQIDTEPVTLTVFLVIDGVEYDVETAATLPWVNESNINNAQLHLVVTGVVSGIAEFTVNTARNGTETINGEYMALLRVTGETYSFVVRKNNDLTDTVVYRADNVDVDAPVLIVKVGENDLAADSSVNVNVTVTAESFDTVEVYLDGEVIASDFSAINGKVTFSANGTYRIEAKDAAGNVRTFTFTISKPNYALISSLSVIGALMLAFIAYLVWRSIRNAAAMKRLIGTATDSDDANKFMMFRKAK
jgi:hypothetical protein